MSQSTSKYCIDANVFIQAWNNYYWSIADPWVIAHAMDQNACVVTKEKKQTTRTDRIKIPNVCEKMGIRCIDDFQLIEELGIRFSCMMPS